MGRRPRLINDTDLNAANSPDKIPQGDSCNMNDFAFDADDDRVENPVDLGVTLNGGLMIGGMSQEDQDILRAMNEAKVEFKRALNWFKFLNGGLSAAQEDAVADDILSFGKPLSTPALIMYLSQFNPNQKVEKLIRRSESRLFDLLKVHQELDYTDSIISQGGDTGL